MSRCIKGIRLNVGNYNNSQYHIWRQIICLGTVAVNMAYLRLREEGVLESLNFFFKQFFMCIIKQGMSWIELETPGTT